jgi:hypothetical protein
MFKSKFKEVITKSKDFEVIKDVEALSVEGGADHCVALNNCGTFDGYCDILSNCGTYTNSMK